jgi:hypothetical protein
LRIAPGVARHLVEVAQQFERVRAGPVADRAPAVGHSGSRGAPPAERCRKAPKSIAARSLVEISSLELIFSRGSAPTATHDRDKAVVKLQARRHRPAIRRTACRLCSSV